MDKTKSLALGLLVILSGILVCWGIGELVVIPFDMPERNLAARIFLRSSFGLGAIMATVAIGAAALTMGEAIRESSKNG